MEEDILQAITKTNKLVCGSETLTLNDRERKMLELVSNEDLFEVLTSEKWREKIKEDEVVAEEKQDAISRLLSENNHQLRHFLELLKPKGGVSLNDSFFSQL